MQKLKTVWADNVGDKPLQEYPRPQFVRDSYLNLNGIWQYAIVDRDKEKFDFDGEILVPFSPESILSKVDKVVTPKDALWYKRTFVIEEGFNRGRILINFGAVDYYCKVFINGIEVGENYGGYYPFTFDITKEVKVGDNEIVVYVLDDTDASFHEVGKQKLKRGGIWYTPTSGIWQTVFIESVPTDYIKSIKITPNLFEKKCLVEIDRVGENKLIKVKALFNEENVFQWEGDSNSVEISLNDVFAWSPESPNLYDLEITFGEDKITSYFAMRSVEIKMCCDGFKRIYLNGNPYYMNGLLDQGYWSDGIYTAPTDQALIFDIEKCKQLGFNTLRKHIKIEPLRWYYHCDRIGMIVWQDMISGGNADNMSISRLKVAFNFYIKDNNYWFLGRKSEDGKREYYSGLERMINHLYNTPSIVLWTPFNEGWGQFDANYTYDFVKKMDNTRLIDHASGWFDQKGLDFKSEHIYFKPVKVKLDKGENKRPYILTEFGGYSLKLLEHSFNLKKTFAYKHFTDKEIFNKELKEMFMRDVVDNIDNGLCGSIYTQVADVEDETNGIFTYDRVIQKVDTEVGKEIMSEIDKKYNLLY